MSSTSSSFRTQPTLKPSHKDVGIDIPPSNDSNHLNHKQRRGSPLPTQSLPGEVQSLSRELQENPSSSQVARFDDYRNEPQSKAANKSFCFYSGMMKSGSSSDSDSSDEVDDPIQTFVRFNNELNDNYDEFAGMVSRLQLEDEGELETDYSTVNSTNYKYSWSQDYFTDTDEDCRPTSKKIKIS